MYDQKLNFFLFWFFYFVHISMVVIFCLIDKSKGSFRFLWWLVLEPNNFCGDINVCLCNTLDQAHFWYLGWNGWDIATDPTLNFLGGSSFW